jgi:hypothetical protein
VQAGADSTCCFDGREQTGEWIFLGVKDTKDALNLLREQRVDVECVLGS